MFGANEQTTGINTWDRRDWVGVDFGTRIFNHISLSNVLMSDDVTQDDKINKLMMIDTLPVFEISHE